MRNMLKEEWLVMNRELLSIQIHEIVLRMPLIERLKMVFTGAFNIHAEISLEMNAFRMHKISVRAVRAKRNSHLQRETDMAPLKIDDLVSEAYKKGYHLGYSGGYQDGKKNGRRNIHE